MDEHTYKLSFGNLIRHEVFCTGKEVKAIRESNLKGCFGWRVQQNEAIMLATKCKLDQGLSNEGPRPTRERQSEVSPTCHHF